MKEEIFMKSKKLVALGLAAAMCVSLAACGGSGSSSGKSSSGSATASSGNVANKDKPVVWYNRQPSNSSTGERDSNGLQFNDNTY